MATGLFQGCYSSFPKLHMGSREMVDLLCRIMNHLPSGYLTVCRGKSPFVIGKPSISMDHFPWLCYIVITRGYLLG